MSGRKEILVTFGFVLSVSLIAAAVSVWIVSRHYSRFSFELLNGICGGMLEQEPEARGLIAAALKEYTGGNPDGAGKQDVLSSLGYRASDFSDAGVGGSVLFASAGFMTGVSLFALVFLYRNKKETMRIRALAEYLEQAENGKAAVLSAVGEDDFSRLEDEIYKTVTFLYQTRDSAVRAKNDFAENLSNIAHQIRTPITAVSLSVQMMKQKENLCSELLEQKENLPGRHLEQNKNLCGEHLEKKKNLCGEHLEQIEKQLSRLTRLEEALLVLSRIDAGTLLLQKDEVDVFTLLVLAADNLQELFDGSRTLVDIPELGETPVTADLDWTMEAVMNLMKNCMEHAPGGTVHCSYARNPLYTEILIWDEGEGFAEEDIPRLFERFYRGRNAGEGGIGIGLAIAKELIERQNGTVRARNRPEGGALFEIRFYSH